MFQAYYGVAEQKQCFLFGSVKKFKFAGLFLKQN
jgi:hypothetical protein